MTVYTECHQLSPRILLHKGDPVKLRGETGTFRFLGVRPEGTVDIIGPCRKDQPCLWRTVRAERLKSAGRISRVDVEPIPEIADVNRRAQASIGGRKRR